MSDNIQPTGPDRLPFDQRHRMSYGESASGDQPAAPAPPPSQAPRDLTSQQPAHPATPTGSSTGSSTGSDHLFARPTTPPAGAHLSPTAPARKQGSAPRTWATATAVGVLSALLASGSTYAVVQAGDATPTVSEASTGSTPSTSPVSNASYQPSEDWAGVAGRVTPSVVSILVATKQGEAAGSGVVWDTQGHIVTNAHVVSGATQVEVTLADGRTYKASVVGADASTDLAVIKLTDGPSDLTPITVGKDTTLTVGDPVMAVGNPLGLSGTVTTGIVSALDRPVTTAAENAMPGDTSAEVVTNAIQTSAAINPGNSGGALVDSSGQLVGINSSIASLSSGVGGQSGSIGIGFAIPVTEVSSVAGQLIDSGTVQHAFLGVGLNDTQAADGSATRAAAEVTQVEPGSPAATAGLKTGDAIIDINGEPVNGAIGLVAQIRERTAGDQVVLGYLRDGERHEVTVTLDARADSGQG